MLFFSPPRRVKAVREDLGLQRLALETCRGHLRCLRAGAAQPSSGGGGSLAVDVGGGPSAKGVAGGVHGGGPRDEADAGRAGKAAVKRCAVLAPLLLKEFFRQVGASCESYLAVGAGREWATRCLRRRSGVCWRWNCCCEKPRSFVSADTYMFRGVV